MKYFLDRLNSSRFEIAENKTKSQISEPKYRSIEST